MDVLQGCLPAKRLSTFNIKAPRCRSRSISLHSPIPDRHLTAYLLNFNFLADLLSYGRGLGPGAHVSFPQAGERCHPAQERDWRPADWTRERVSRGLCEADLWSIGSVPSSAGCSSGQDGVVRPIGARCAGWHTEPNGSRNPHPGCAAPLPAPLKNCLPSPGVLESCPYAADLRQVPEASEGRRSRKGRGTVDFSRNFKHSQLCH